jgi:hypothetical protein
MIYVPPFRGEFGHIVMHHSPGVRALPRPVTVAIEPGMEAMYPECEYDYCDRREDKERRASYKMDRDYVRQWVNGVKRRHPGAKLAEPDRFWKKPRQWFIPQPVETYGIEADVLVCPRRRDFGPERNWPHWPALVETLAADGLKLFAGGKREASADVPCAAAWDHPRELDATLEAMLSAELVIATDTGLAHLAVMAGRPLLMLTSGEHCDPSKRWPVEMWRYEEENHLDTPIHRVDAWDEPEKVAGLARRLLAGGGGELRAAG